MPTSLCSLSGAAPRFFIPDRYRASVATSDSTGGRSRVAAVFVSRTSPSAVQMQKPSCANLVRRPREGRSRQVLWVQTPAQESKTGTSALITKMSMLIYQLQAAHQLCACGKDTSGVA